MRLETRLHVVLSLSYLSLISLYRDASLPPPPNPLRPLFDAPPTVYCSWVARRPYVRVIAALSSPVGIPPTPSQGPQIGW